ncbi:hypothetical protein D3C84_1274810 [compost metagenome]
MRVLNSVVEQVQDHLFDFVRVTLTVCLWLQEEGDRSLTCQQSQLVLHLVEQLIHRRLRLLEGRRTIQSSQQQQVLD